VVSAATERTADARNASFLIVIAPFKNLSPRLDLRTDLASKITKPQGRRTAKVSKIILRAVITPPVISPIHGSSTHFEYAKGAPILLSSKVFICKQLDIKRGF
jgi:hypothetical protein